MKLIVLTGLYPPYYKGGHEISTKFIADGLLGRGHEVTVLTSDYGARSNEVEEKGVFRLLRHFETGTTSGIMNRYRQVCNGVRGRINYHVTRRFLSRFPADLVFAGQMENVSVLPLKAVRDQGLPIVHHVGNFDIPLLAVSYRNEKNSLKRLYRRTVTGFGGLEGLDLRNVIAVSGAVRKVYIEAGLPPESISIIPPLGIADRCIERRQVGQCQQGATSLKLLCVGRIVEEKGIHVAIESICHLKKLDPELNVRLDVIGDGNKEYLEHLKQMSADLTSPTSTVTFRDGMSRAEILTQYRNYDMLLVPSIWQEPFGMVVLEAMSQGVPVVASRVGGIPETICDGESGLLVPPDDPLKLAKAIKRLVDEPSLRKDIIDNGYKTIEDRFSESRILDKIEQCLNNALSSV